MSAQPPAAAVSSPLAPDMAAKIDAYWRACNYLAAGMIYLLDNPLLREPLKEEHIKKRLLGHWGSSPGLAFMYVHLNRIINAHEQEAIFLAGPGHGAPGVLAPVYLEGTYSEIYPNKSEDEEGMKAFFKQFSFPGGIGSHCTPETPGSIHEGGELGYSISHAFGAAFDNPNLLVAVAVGDGESETGPLATSWHSSKFLNPIRDGAVLPILHLNGYKINNPTLLSRIPKGELAELMRGYGWTPHFVEGDDPMTMHQQMAATMDACYAAIRAFQDEARSSGKATRCHWPMIVLRTPKGWTGPKEVDGRKVEGFWRAHQVPLSGLHNNPPHLHQLEAWLKSYRPEQLFDERGKLIPELRALAPKGTLRMSANPHANGGLLREHFDDIKIRFINVVDLFKLQPAGEHPHGLSDADFDSLFTKDRPIIFNFHGYPWLIHRLAYRRTNHRNLHVRGYKEKGSINTPLELAIQNEIDRFSLAIDVINRVPRLQVAGAHIKQRLRDMQIECRNYAYEYGIDKPAIDDWTWPL